MPRRGRLVVDLKPGDTRRRAGFIFVSSPDSVTPAHFDIEHSLLLQLSGQKRVTVGRFADEQTRLHERERYWEGALGRVNDMPVVVEPHDLTPGMGIYLPPICPHWVHNGDQVSISMTLTYFTIQSERDQQIEAFNAKLRKLHMHPVPPGRRRRATSPRPRSCARGACVAASSGTASRSRDRTSGAVRVRGAGHRRHANALRGDVGASATPAGDPWRSAAARGGARRWRSPTCTPPRRAAGRPRADRDGRRRR